jgi:hypothetical protein
MVAIIVYTYYHYLNIFSFLDTQTSSNNTNGQYKRYDVLWSFENTATDVDNLYKGFLINNPFYTSGYVGKAISLNGVDQYIDTSSFISFYNRSFTVEVWVYWLDLYNYTFNGILGQCSCDETCASKCLHLMIRDKHAYLGFNRNDLKGHTIIENSTWVHLAFVYDYQVLGQQEVYVNGLFDGGQVTKAYQGVQNYIQIGRTDISTGVESGRSFTGLIDQLSITLRAKTAAEILEDATLCAYYSFDLGSLADLGPNGLNGSAVNTKSVKGQVNQALQFSSPVAYFQAAGFVALGTSNKEFSIAFWIKPVQVDGGTIVYVSNSANSWCLPFIGFTKDGVIVTQIKSNKNTIVTTLGPILKTKVWTHVATTYSISNGQKIYINGLMYSSSITNILYNASGEPNYITIGSPSTLNSLCNQGQIRAGQFYGSIDELRIYSRELTALDMHILVNT